MKVFVQHSPKAGQKRPLGKPYFRYFGIIAWKSKEGTKYKVKWKKIFPKKEHEGDLSKRKYRFSLLVLYDYI